jgi:hypothetical protein
LSGSAGFGKQIPERRKRGYARPQSVKGGTLAIQSYALGVDV